MNSFETVVPIADIKKARVAIEAALVFFEADQVRRSQMMMKDLGTPWPISISLKESYDRLTNILGEHLIQLEDQVSEEPEPEEELPPLSSDLENSKLLAGPRLDRVRNKWQPKDEVDDNGLDESGLPEPEADSSS